MFVFYVDCDGMFKVGWGLCFGEVVVGGCWLGCWSKGCDGGRGGVGFVEVDCYGWGMGVEVVVVDDYGDGGVVVF